MSSFLLIHGNRHGKWAWESVLRLLRERKYEAHAIDLPGHGEDLTPREEVTLESYRKAVCEFVIAHDMRDLILVGHSGGGATLAAVAGDLRERLSRLVFIAALVPLQGESLMNYIPQERHDAYRKIAEESSDNSVPISWEQARKRYFEEVSKENARALFEKLTPEPFGAMLSSVPNDALLELDVPKDYVLCLNDLSLPLETCRTCAERIGAKIIELPSGHNAMLSHPKEITDILCMPLQGSDS